MLAIGLRVGPAVAADTRSFDIPAGPADRAVRQFVRQAKMSVIYEAGRLNRYQTRAIRGQYTPVDALETLLSGSGLSFSMTTPDFVSVHPEKKPGTSPAGSELPIVQISTHAAPTAPVLPRSIQRTTVTAEELSQQGFTTLPEFLRTLTQSQGAGASESTTFLREAPTNVAFGSGLNLYGVGQRSTLVLVNGRRLAPGGTAGSFTDVLNLPISAVDHIDLIGDGASTIYGADAVGGIVNFILRDGYSRPLTTLSVGNLTRNGLAGDDFSQSYAHTSEQWRGIAAVELYHRDGLPAYDRSQATSNLSPRGGSNFDVLTGNPGNIIDASSRIRGIPGGQSGTSLTVGQLSDAPNMYDRHADTWMLPRQNRLSLLASGSLDVTEGTTLFMDSLLTRRWITNYSPAEMAVLLVPNSGAFKIDGLGSPVQVAYGFGKDLGPVVERGSVDSGQLALGLKHEINNRWGSSVTAGYTFDNQFETESNLVDFGKLDTYLGLDSAAGGFDPFGDGSYTSRDTLAQIRTQGTVEYRSAFETLNAELTGSLPMLSAGDVTLTAGSDLRRQTFGSYVSPGYIAGLPGDASFPKQNEQRFLSAAYVQAGVPVLSGEAKLGGGYEVNLTAGLRYEHYSHVGSAYLPSFGFSFGLDNGFALTGTWSRMFRPPNLSDLNESLNYAAVYVLPDTSSSTGYTTALFQGGNNAALSPETAHSWTVGLKFSPTYEPNFSIDLQYYNIVLFNQVQQPPALPPDLFSLPQYNYLITRNVAPDTLASICSHVPKFVGPSDQCRSTDISAIVDLRLRSAQTVRTDGLDLKSLYAYDSPIGLLRLSLQSTYILRFKEVQTPGGPLISYRNTPHYPTAFRLRSVLGWERGRFFASPALNFQGRYFDNVSTPNRPIHSWSTIDLVVGYRLEPLSKVMKGDTTLSLRAFNVFNKQPPFVNNGYDLVGYDPENADLLGRRLSLKIEYEW